MAQMTDSPASEEAAARSAPSRAGQIARSTVVVMVAFGVAKALSLAQTFIIAQVFGVGREWDAFVTANSIPELIFTLVAGGALAHAFIPVFGGFLARGDTAGAWKVASHVVNTIFAVTMLISIVAFLIAPWLVATVVAPGFDAAGKAQTVELMRILLLSTLIFSVSGIVMGMLQSFNHFLLPALAPIMFDVGILFGVVFLTRPQLVTGSEDILFLVRPQLPEVGGEIFYLTRGFGVYGIAIGAVLGAALHFAIQVPGLIRFRARWSPELGFRDPDFWRIIRLMLPRIAGLGVFSFNFIIMNNIASRMGEGSVSALSWGWRLMQIPQTLIGTAMGTVIFPTLAALSAMGDENGKRDAMSGALRFILIASIPAAVGLIVVGRPLISLLERGAFDSSASAFVYSTLQGFALGLIVHSMLEVVARSFYADKDTLTPLWAALGGAAINLTLSFLLSDINRVEPFRLTNLTAVQFPALNMQTYVGYVGGLAWANSIGTAFEVLVLLFWLRRRWHGINQSDLAATTIKTLVASLLMALAILAVEAIWTALGLDGRGLAFTIAEIGLTVVVGAIVFAVSAYVMKLNELNMLLNIVRRRKVVTV